MPLFGVKFEKIFLFPSKELEISSLAIQEIVYQVITDKEANRRKFV